jgi:Secretion system C-terminal sorting domain
MKSISVVLIFIPFLSWSQSKLLVINGYNSGTYKAGDTIHVFAKEEKNDETFEVWTGDTAYVDDPSDWHALLKMPAKDITITATFKSLPAGAKLKFERLKGRDTLKPVYYYFPSKGQPVKALVWIFHGTGGSYTSFAGQVEGQSIIKTLMAHDYAVAISECDERTYNKDIIPDGNIRWDYTIPDGLSKNGRDMANHMIFRDTFVNRGYMNAALPEVSLGFSAGGAFSLYNGWILGYKKGINFNSQGTFIAADKSTMPSQFFMSFNDNHPDVGKTGNDTAFQNYTKMVNRGLCAAFNMFYPWPCYPEYFKRIPGIDSAKSITLFNELKSMNAVNVQNYGRLSPDQIILNIKAQPGKYPALLSLTTDQAQELDDQLSVLLTFHHFHSHFNGKLVKFFDESCGKISTPYQDIKSQPSFNIFPNPARDQLNIKLPDITDQNFEIRLFDLEGRMIKREVWTVLNNEMITLYLNALPPGLYLLGIRGDKGYIKVEKAEIH